MKKGILVIFFFVHEMAFSQQSPFPKAVLDNKETLDLIFRGLKLSLQDLKDTASEIKLEGKRLVLKQGFNLLGCQKDMVWSHKQKNTRHIFLLSCESEVVFDVAFDFFLKHVSFSVVDFLNLNWPELNADQDLEVKSESSGFYLLIRKNDFYVDSSKQSFTYKVTSHTQKESLSYQYTFSFGSFVGPEYVIESKKFYNNFYAYTYKRNGVLVTESRFLRVFNGPIQSNLSRALVL